MSHRTHTAIAHRTHRAQIGRASMFGGLLLLVGLIVTFLAATGADTSAQIVDRSISAGGLIAYSNANHEIWLSAPDGGSARKLWEVPQAYRGSMVSGITNLSWNKDGSMLAFVSGHEPHCSWYETNLYVINVDGSGFRRITNRPSCEEATTLPTGSVSVTVRNDFNEVMSVEVTVEGAAAHLRHPAAAGLPRGDRPQCPRLGRRPAAKCGGHRGRQPLAFIQRRRDRRADGERRRVGDLRRRSGEQCHRVEPHLEPRRPDARLSAFRAIDAARACERRQSATQRRSTQRIGADNRRR
ncbi:MAG: hypothetical protein R2856_30375 [Caldilineaceae bacterium]